MHGSSSVPQDLLAMIRKYGGNMKETYGVPVEEIQEAHQARRAQDQHRHRHPPGDDRRDPQVTWPRTPRSSTRATTSSRRAKRPRQICKQRYIAVRLRRPGREDQADAAAGRGRAATRRASWRKSCTEPLSARSHRAVAFSARSVRSPRRAFRQPLMTAVCTIRHHVPAAARARQGARQLRGRRRPHADGRERPPVAPSTSSWASRSPARASC